jgi:hypothetical protein
MDSYRSSKINAQQLREVDKMFNRIAIGLGLFWGLVSGGITMFSSPAISSGQMLVIPVALVVFVVVFGLTKLFLWWNYGASNGQ